ncbi:MAG: hypothetical protein EA378_06190 [Phycisphaerales bacterium]|nr:MAG: hypothetical protein EA378_06190 [Phycisphaerales bacterium]
MPDAQHTLQPGTRLRITQSVPRQSGAMTTAVEGLVLRAGQQKSGSWFAHTRDHKVWIDRVELQKDDGELVHCNIDQHTRVEILAAPEQPSTTA